MSSKLRKLKQQAYEAGRKRDWSGAADAYAQILDMDKNNPSLLNEYGDVCLKAGETSKAIRQFLAAAAKYKQNGLLNNAQAVYKKVLRHDAKNLNANWFLAEIRSSQGLVADGVAHALTFLASAEDVSGEIKEIFHKRCLELFELYPESDEVLERVEGIFRIWDMQLEKARAGCLRACLAHRAGDADAAQAGIDKLLAEVPEIANYAEYTRWQQTLGGLAAPAESTDFNTIELGGEPAADTTAAAEVPAAEPAVDDITLDDPAADMPAEENPVAEADAAAEPAVSPETPADAAAAFEEFLDDGGELETTTDGSILGAADDAAVEIDVEKDEEGCIAIDIDDDSTDFAELIETAVEGVAADADAADEPASADALAKSSGSVNLLDEILAEEGDDLLRSSDTEQVSTIASEIGRNLGDQQDSDPETQYQQGLVYLEMGLYDQAALAFSAAAADPVHSAQSREMWGIALHREGRLDEALVVLKEGLADAEAGDRSVLGLHYQAGRILEELERGDEAQEHYRRVHAVDAGFADVAGRLRAPVA